MELLKEMCQIHAPSGNEIKMTEFVLNYIAKNKKNWKVKVAVTVEVKLIPYKSAAAIKL
jgi:putative aminopeptidase FrvX